MFKERSIEICGVATTEQGQAPAGAEPSEFPGVPSASPFDAASEMNGSVIGTDLTILGDKITIISHKSLQIDGDIRGDVAGKQVTIGKDGSVIGTVSSETVDIHGGVRGAIHAKSVSLHPTAQVDGEIVHRSLIISEGAQFEGHVRRPKSEADLTPNLDANSYATASLQGAPVAAGPTVIPVAKPSAPGAGQK